MLRFFQDLERLTYSMVVRRESDNPRIARFGELTKSIEAGLDIWGNDSKLQLSPPEQWDTYEVLSGDFYLLLKSGGSRRAVLLRLDSLIAGAEATYDYPIISVEHVLPQNPATGSDWSAWFPTPEIRSAWTHKIGNLALLTKSTNSSAKNWPFPVKKEKYFKRKGVTTMALTVQVLGHEAWTPEVIASRQKALLTTLEQHWRLQDRKSAADWLIQNL